MHVPLCSCHCHLSPGRIYDGNDDGVAFMKGGKGRVQDCQIWGYGLSGVGVQGGGSEAVVAGCKCAGGRDGGGAFLKTRAFQINRALLFPPLLNIARQDSRWKSGLGRGVFRQRRQRAGGGLQDLGQRARWRDYSRRRLRGRGGGLRVRGRKGGVFSASPSPSCLATPRGPPDLPYNARQDSRWKIGWDHFRPWRLGGG